jgi:hypothetical protein
MLAVPAQAPAAPAGSEYILRVPHAKGDSSSSGVVPTTTSQTATGPTKPKYRRPAGPAGRRTGSELVSTDTSGSASFLGALGTALLDPLVLALLGVIALGSAFALRTRHTAPEV